MRCMRLDEQGFQKVSKCNCNTIKGLIGYTHVALRQEGWKGKWNSFLTEKKSLSGHKMAALCTSAYCTHHSQRPSSVNLSVLINTYHFRLFASSSLMFCLTFSSNMASFICLVFIPSLPWQRTGRISESHILDWIFNWEITLMVITELLNTQATSAKVSFLQK